jgi:putative phage-type endonuclease
MEIITTCDQNSPEWFDLRLGSIGGSSISAILARGKGRQTLIYKLAAEKLTGVKTESYQTGYMDRGHEYEPQAREYYEFVTGHAVEQVALIKGDMEGTHASPDGLCGEDGGIEIKTRLPHVFVEKVDIGKIEKSTTQQCQHLLWVSGRQWVDVIEYCPEISNPAHIVRVVRDIKTIQDIQRECKSFIIELNELINKMRTR